MTAVKKGQVWQSKAKADGGRRIQIAEDPTTLVGASWGWVKAQNTKTGRTSTLQFTDSGLASKWRLIDACEVCGRGERTAGEAPGHVPCCSSHGLVLCCACYRRGHFVEVGPCCSSEAGASESAEG